MTLSTSQEYSSSKAPQPQLIHRYSNSQKQQLLEWAALLPTHTEAEQANQLEKILTELTMANSEDNLHLKLVSIVITAAERVITNIRQHYIYETESFTESQLSDVAQVKSLYHLIVSVYDCIVRREVYTLDYHYRQRQQQRKQSSSNHWKHYFTRPKLPPFTLAVAIYQSLLTYQKLFIEEAISYQPPPASLWSAVNHLYHLACQYHIAHTDLSPYVVTRHAYNIHRLYCEICLHSLLNVCAMRRHNILLVQRLLPEWAEHMVATREPQTKTRVFVDLRSDKPPTYLTSQSKINPYNEQHVCLFIELAPLVAHLQLRAQTSANSGNNIIECFLMTQIWMAISYRYIQPQLTVLSEYTPRQRATIITDFNDIHYHVAGEKGLMSLIAIAELPPEQQPVYDTLPKKQATCNVLAVNTFDSKDAMSHFRRLQLLPMSDEANLAVDTKDKFLIRSADLVADIVDVDEYVNSTAPPLLRLMSLFLLCHPHTDIDNCNGSNKDSATIPKWSIGIVRWLNLDSQKTNNQNPDNQRADNQSTDNQSTDGISADKLSTDSRKVDNQSLEVEWQVIGHELTACAVRLYSSGTRSQHFLPALLVGGDEQLQTACSLLLPGYSFQTNDKVMMRINNRQEPLRLQRSVHSTEAFSQYEVVRL